MNPFNVVIDAAQARISKDRISTIITGDDWNYALSSNVFIEPVTRTVMLSPLPLTDGWRTSHTGDYARFGIADYTLTTPSKWTQGDKVGDGHSNYLYSLNVNEVLKTTGTYGANRGIYLSFFAPSSGNERHVQIDFGWGNTANYQSGVSVRIWSDGHVEIWKAGVQVGAGSISGRADDQQQHLALKTTDIYAIPYRNRELLIFSNQGGAFRHTFEDLTEAPGQTITPDEKIWWYVPEGDATVQCAPLRFATSGYICSRKVIFAQSASGASSGTVYVDNGSASYSLVQPDNINSSFSSGTECRVKVSFSGGTGTSTPYVHAVAVEFPRQTAQTNAGSYTLNPYITSMSLDVPEEPSSVQMEIELKKPSELETTEGVSKLRRISNRAIKCTFGTQDVLIGRTEPPEWHEAIDDGARRVTLRIRDKWKVFEHYIFSDPYPLDGLNIVDAFKFIIKAAGFEDSDIDIPPIAFNLPQVKTQSESFNILIEVGDTAADWLKRLHETYCATYMMGWFPTASGFKFRLFLPDNNEAPKQTLFKTLEEAYSHLIGIGQLEEDANRNKRNYVFRSFKETVLEPEANYIYVTGRDPRSDRPIVAHKIDSASANPTTVISLRPDNWLGEIRKYGWVDETITTLDAAQYACNIIYNRLTPIRRIAEWESELLLDTTGKVLWRGDVVELKGYGKFRITSLSAELNHEPTNDDANRHWRPTTYVGEYIGESTP